MSEMATTVVAPQSVDVLVTAHRARRNPLGQPARVGVDAVEFIHPSTVSAGCDDS
jgi:hypothetical protein